MDLRHKMRNRRTGWFEINLSDLRVDYPLDFARQRSRSPSAPSSDIREALDTFREVSDVVNRRKDAPEVATERTNRAIPGKGKKTTKKAVDGKGAPAPKAAEAVNRKQKRPQKRTGKAAKRR